MDVAEVLLDRWELKPERLDVLTGGMNSAAWLAPTDDSVQAASFAWRCANDIRTGIADPAENRKGLADAHHAFASVQGQSCRPVMGCRCLAGWGFG